MLEKTDKKYDKEECIRLLQNKYQELQEQGLTRYPQRSDFNNTEVVAIKSFFGPWPRALEAAGVKPPRPDEDIIKQRSKEKRIRAKRNRIAALKKIERERKKNNGEAQ